MSDYVRKRWDSSTRISPDDFNRIEIAIEELYQKLSEIESTKPATIETIKEDDSNELLLHEIDGQAHAELFSAIYVQVTDSLNKLEKKIKSLETQLKSIKKELNKEKD